MDAKYTNLIKRLIKSTENSQVEWKKSSINRQYRLELKAATFVVDESEELDEYDNEIIITTYELTMYNDNNMEIKIAKASNTSFQSDEYALLLKLYDAAEKSCTKENETIKNVMAELDSLDLPF